MNKQNIIKKLGKLIDVIGVIAAVILIGIFAIYYFNPALILTPTYTEVSGITKQEVKNFIKPLVKNIQQNCLIANETTAERQNCEIWLSLYFTGNYIVYLEDSTFESVQDLRLVFAQGGDCEDKALFFCAMMEQMNYGCLILTKKGIKYRHAFVRVTAQDKIVCADPTGAEVVSCEIFDEEDTKVYWDGV